jgi:hypothetical protein
VTRERLEKLSLPALREIAKKEGIRAGNSLSCEELIELVLEAMEEDRNEREHLNNLAIRVEEKKYDIIIDEELESQVQHIYCIPDRYNETKIMLILRDPLWAFAYWDIKDTDIEDLKSRFSVFELILRVHESREALLSDVEFEDSFDIPVSLTDSRWYLNLPRTGSSYHVELIGKHRKKESVLCSSNKIHSPRATIAGPLEKATVLDSKNDILALSGLYSVGDTFRNNMIPQRIISLLDANNYSLK